MTYLINRYVFHAGLLGNTLGTVLRYGEEKSLSSF